MQKLKGTSSAYIIVMIVMLNHETVDHFTSDFASSRLLHTKLHLL